MTNQAFFYSVVQVLPDPVRNEGVNIGVIVVDATGESSDARFASVTRVRKLDCPFAEDAVQRFIRSVHARLEPSPQLFPPESPTLNESILSEWSREFGGEVRLTVPRFTGGASLPEILSRLYGRFVSPPRPKRRVDKTGIVLLSHFDKAMSRVTFDGLPITVSSDPVRGDQATHQLDRVLFTAHSSKPAAAAHAISFSKASVDSILADRAVVIVAAEDIHDRSPEVLVLALLGGDGGDRLGLVEETLGLLQERQVVPIDSQEVDSVGNVLLDHWQPALLPG
jgi:Protein of unknown function (DUF3037)